MAPLLLIMFVFNTLFTQAAQSKHRLNDAYALCYSDQNGGFDILDCTMKVSEAWTKEITKQCNGLMNVPDTTTRHDLKQAQGLWIKYKDLEFKLSSSLPDEAVKTTQDSTPTSKNDSVLITPDSLFFKQLDASKRDDAEYVIGKYMETYFEVTKQKEVIEKASMDHTEIPGEDCRYKTEYKNITIIEDFGCDSYFQTTTMAFSNYSFEEVKRIIKILLPKEYSRKENDGSPEDYTGWDKSGRYYNYNDNCSLDILKENKKILMSYGCSC